MPHLTSVPDGAGLNPDTEQPASIADGDKQIVSTVHNVPRPHVISPADFFTIPVQCSGVLSPVLSLHHDTVFTIVTADMTVQDLVSIVLARCNLKGTEPSSFCIVAERVLDKCTKGSTAGHAILETCVLDDGASPLETEACLSGGTST
ncbi:hypothetical protein BaRGS_00014358, partial [Batillaria attramentaria]